MIEKKNYLMELKFKNIYGLTKNMDQEFVIKSEKPHVFVYGPNTLGKTSITDGIHDVINKKPYIGRLTEDQNKDFLISINLDKINFEYKKGDDITKFQNIDNIFIYNKYFAENSIDTETNSIGNSITEFNFLIKENSENLEEIIKHLISILKKSNIPTTQTAPLTETKAYYLFSDKKIGSIKRIEKLDNEIVAKIKEVVNQSFEYGGVAYEKGDLINKNFQEFEKFVTNLKNVNSEIIKKLIEKRKELKYEIETIDHYKFYDAVINYLNIYDKNTCPVCLTTEGIDINVIKKEIEEALKIVKTEEVFKKLEISYNKIIDIKDESVLKDVISDVYHKVVALDSSYTEINFQEKIDILRKDYDKFYFKSIVGDKKIMDLINSYENKNIKIEKIIDKNKDINNSKFIKMFKTNLDKYFENDLFNVNAELTDLYLVENTKRIDLDFFSKTTNEKVENKKVFKILSESEKSKLSLIFFITTVEYFFEIKTLKRVLCVFDDPIDSYDSINKYKLSSLIRDFCYRENSFSNDVNINSLFLSHSVDYMRLWDKDFYDSNKDFKVMTKSGVDDFTADEVYLFKGDFEILKQKVFNKQEINFNELLAISPILRELAAYSSSIIQLNTNEDLKIMDERVENLNKELSQSVVHFCVDKKTNFDIKEVLSKYIKPTIIIDENEEEKSIEKHLKEVTEGIIDKIKTSPKLTFETRMLYKNLFALYIKGIADKCLSEIIIKFDYSKKDYKDVHKLSFEVGKKLSKAKELLAKIEKDPNEELTHIKQVVNEISSSLTLLNDFSHSANLYLTPLIDVKFDDLIDTYHQTKKWETSLLRKKCL